MIRDPSDGSVREMMPGAKPGIGGFSPLIETSTSGLPIAKAKAEYLARLELSRERSLLT